LFHVIQTESEKAVKCILGALAFNLITPHLGPLPNGERRKSSLFSEGIGFTMMSSS
jgi:hypothetical protein